MESFYWLILFVVLLAIEIPTMALTTIWFAGGALIAFLATLAGAGLELQIGLFVIVSCILLFFTRPIVVRFINKNTTKTNVESLIGKTARITEQVNNQQSIGTAVLNGQEWTARAYNDQSIIEVGAIVQVRDIKGVKLIVEGLKGDK